MVTKFFVGSDHGGLELKHFLVNHLKKQSFKVEDLGTNSNESCDYIEFAKKVAESVVKNPGSLGLLVCGTGIGMSIAANKIKGIRAALIFDEFTGKMAREHNNANIVCLGERTTEKETALKALNAFIETEFVGDRHERRVNKIMELEK